MKILLIAPEENIPILQELYPSGALLLIGTMLQAKGHIVRVTHMTADRQSIASIEELTKSFTPDIVGITLNTYQVRSAKEISKAIKGISSSILVVVGGPHPSALKASIFADIPFVDVAVYGEGEHAFMEIVDGHDLSTITGICYQGKMNAPREIETNLDYMPFPNLGLIGSLSKFAGSHFDELSPSINIMGSRGCPFQCTYCNTSVWGKQVRMRKPELLVEEIEYLAKTYSIREFHFSDDTFNLTRAWTEEIFSRIIEKKLHTSFVFSAPFRVNKKLLDEKLLAFARAANFKTIHYGVENGNQEMLNSMKKGISIEEIVRAFKITHAAGIKPISSFMIGLPGETKKTVSDSIKLLRKIKPFCTGFGVAIPFPGTQFRDDLIKSGHLLQTPFDEYSPKICVVRTNALSSEEIVRLSAKANFLATWICKGNRNVFLKGVLKNPIGFIHEKLRRWGVSKQKQSFHSK